MKALHASLRGTNTLVSAFSFSDFLEHLASTEVTLELPGLVIPGYGLIVNMVDLETYCIGLELSDGGQVYLKSTWESSNFSIVALDGVHAWSRIGMSLVCLSCDATKLSLVGCSCNWFR